MLNIDDMLVADTIQFECRYTRLNMGGDDLQDLCGEFAGLPHLIYLFRCLNCDAHVKSLESPGGCWIGSATSMKSHTGLSRQAGYGIKRPAESQTVQYSNSAEARQGFSRVKKHTHTDTWSWVPWVTLYRADLCLLNSIIGLDYGVCGGSTRYNSGVTHE